jgi:hypothetical protein
VIPNVRLYTITLDYANLTNKHCHLKCKNFFDILDFFTVIEILHHDGQQGFYQRLAHAYAIEAYLEH